MPKDSIFPAIFHISLRFDFSGTFDRDNEVMKIEDNRHIFNLHIRINAISISIGRPQLQSGRQIKVYTISFAQISVKKSVSCLQMYFAALTRTSRLSIVRNQIQIYLDQLTMSDRFGHIPIEPPESAPVTKRPAKRLSRTKAAPSPKGGKHSPGKVWALLTGAAVILSLYSALGFIGVPYYVKKILPRNFHDQTGMSFEPTAISFNPFTFRFTSGELRILSAGGKPILSLQSLSAALSPTGLFHLNMVCNSIAVSKPEVNVSRELDGSYNFPKIPSAEKNSNPWNIFNLTSLPVHFSLNNISINDGRMTFNDLPAGKVHTVEKIQLNLPSFSNIPFQADQSVRPHFSAVVNGSPIELTGQAHLGESEEMTETTKLSLNIHDLDLAGYVDYLPFSLPLDIKKATANGTIDLAFKQHNKEGERLSFGYQLQISDAELVKDNTSILIKTPIVQIQGSLQPVSKTIHIEEIVVKEPTVSSYGLTLPVNSDPSPKADGQHDLAGSGQKPPYSLILDLLVVDKAKLLIFSKIDDSKPSSTWSGMQLNIKNYHSALEGADGKSDGTFSLSGEKEGSPASFSWQGIFPTSQSLTGQLSLIKADAHDLLRTLAAKSPFNLQGVADLTGQFSLFSTSETFAAAGWKLVDAELTIENFSLVEKKQNILTAPVAKLTSLGFEDGKINFGNLRIDKGAAHFSLSRVPESFTKTGTPAYRLKGVDFLGSITVDPLDKGDSPIIFTDVAIKANQLDASQKPTNNLSISGKSANGGIFKAQGAAVPAPFSLSIKAGFSQLAASEVFSFFTDSAQLKKLGGKLSGKGNFSLPAKTFAGELQLTAGSGKGPKGSTFSIQKALLHDFNYAAKPFHLGVGSAIVDRARFSWQITEDDNGPMQYLADFAQQYLPSVDRQATVKPQISISPVDIQEISFTNSIIEVDDHRLTPDWKAQFVDINGRLQNLHSARASAQSMFSFTGKLDAAPFILNGAMDPFAKENNGSLHFSLENYPLSSFAKQLADKTDIDTTVGTFTLVLDSAWQNQQYDRSGNIVFADVQPVSSASDSALPLALLTGEDNTFQLDFDFARPAPAAKESLFAEILTTFQRQALKGSVSPLLLATGDFTDLIGNEFVEFKPGQLLLSDKGKQVLIRYGALLIAHPQVGLVLSGGVEPKIDRPALKERLTAIEKQRVDKENEKRYQQWLEKKNLYEKNFAEQQKKLAAGGKIVEQTIPSDILSGFVPVQPEPVVVDEAMLLDLAKKRIDIISKYITGQLVLQPERLSAIPPDSVAAIAKNQVNGVTISLKALDR